MYHTQIALVHFLSASNCGLKALFKKPFLSDGLLFFNNHQVKETLYGADCNYCIKPVKMAACCKVLLNMLCLT